MKKNMLISSDLPDLSDITKEFINKGYFKLHRVKNEYLLTLNNNKYILLSNTGKPICVLKKREKPETEFKDGLCFSDISFPPLNNLTGE